MMEKLVQSAYYSKDTDKHESHHHDCHQIMLVLKGSIQCRINDTEYIANGGDIVIFSRYENHSVTVLSDEYERYILQLSPLSNRTSDRLYAFLSNRPLGFRNIVNIADYLNEIKHIFCKIIDELDSNNQLADDMIESLVNELLIMIYRLTPHTNYAFDNDNFKMIFEIQRMFEDFFYEQYTLETLALKYHVSASTISHCFKELTGTSPMNYLCACRLAVAKNHLAQSNIEIGKIVEMCGFSDFNNFCRTFKKANGMSPSEFRKKMTNYSALL